MNIREVIKSLVDELNNTHTKLLNNEMPRWESGLPNFTTAENGMLCHFDGKSLSLLRKLTSIIYSNDQAISSSIQEDRLVNVIRKCVADFYAADAFTDYDSGQQEIVRELREYISNEVDRLSREKYTHYFPAWLLLDESAPLLIGPVKISGREVWIDSISLPQSIIEKAGEDWRDQLKGLLKDEVSKEATHVMITSLFRALKACPFIVEVTLTKYEKNLSSKLAESTCKTALDALSLIGRPDFFHQQTLSTERQLPHFISSLTATKGELWFPGGSKTARIGLIDIEKVTEVLDDSKVILNAFGNVLEALAKPTKHQHPSLANRWATALDWFAEGARERNDAIAVAKIATCLDVLSYGGKYKGIREMLENLFDITGRTVVIKGDNPATLSKLVKNIYDNGRSKILHGTNIDKMESLTELRNYSFQIARLALHESVLRLVDYTGDDGDTVFRIIPVAEPEG